MEDNKKKLQMAFFIVLTLTFLSFVFSPGLLVAAFYGVDFKLLNFAKMPLVFAGIEFVFVIFMLLVCRGIVRRGIRKLFQAPSTDSLITFSAFSAIALSGLFIAEMVQSGADLFHQLLFTPLGIFLTLTLGGKYLEARLKEEERTLDDDGVTPLGAEEMIIEREAAIQEKEEERQKKASKARYLELEALRAEERRLADGKDPAQTDEAAAKKADPAQKDAPSTTSLPLFSITDSAALRFFTFGLLIAFLEVVFWQMQGLSPLQTAIIFFAVLFFSCPTALFFATPFALSVALKKCRKEKILVKNAAAFDVLKNVSAIALTKSGAVTKGAPFLSTIVGEGLSESAILSIAASVENGNPHRLARVLVAAAVSRRARLVRVSATSDIAGKGVEALINGRVVRLGKLEWLRQEGVLVSNSLIVRGDQFAARGKITIYLATGGSAKGILVFSDELRLDIAHTIRQLETLGVQTVMLTGDCRSTARRVAKDAGIGIYRFDLTPTARAKEVQLLQAHGHTVALLAGKKQYAKAAERADVVFATQDDVVKADILIDPNDISRIAQLIKLSRRTLMTVRLALTLSFLFALLAIGLLHASCFFLGDLRLLPLLAVLCMLFGIVAAALAPIYLKRFSFTPHTLDY